MKLDREQLVALQRVIHASRAEPVWEAMMKLALHNREDARDKMEDAIDRDALVIAQSDARAWRKVLKYLTDKPLS